VWYGGRWRVLPPDLSIAYWSREAQDRLDRRRFEEPTFGDLRAVLARPPSEATGQAALRALVGMTGREDFAGVVVPYAREHFERWPPQLVTPREELAAWDLGTSAPLQSRDDLRLYAAQRPRCVWVAADDAEFVRELAGGALLEDVEQLHVNAQRLTLDAARSLRELELPRLDSLGVMFSEHERGALEALAQALWFTRLGTLGVLGDAPLDPEEVMGLFIPGRLEHASIPALERWRPEDEERLEALLVGGVKRLGVMGHNGGTQALERALARIDGPIALERLELIHMAAPPDLSAHACLANLEAFMNGTPFGIPLPDLERARRVEALPGLTELRLC
jgi:hypothetical protein